MESTSPHYSHDTVHNLIQLAYLSASRPDGWPMFLRRLCEVMDGANALMSFADRERGGAAVSAWVGVSDEALQLYAEKYGAMDPFAHGTAALGPLRPGFIGLAQDLVSDEELERTTFYQEFGARHGVIGGIVSVIYAEGAISAVVGVGRKPGRHFGAADVALLRTLFPHLRTALHIHRELSADGALAQAALAALDRMNAPVIICDEGARVIHTNAAANRSARWAIRDGAVTAPDNEDSRRLRFAIAAIAAGGTPSEVSIGVITPQNRIVVATVARVYRTDPVAMLRPLVSVVFAPAGAAAAPLAAVFDRYGFTAAERRLAECLVANQSLKSCAASLGITYESARTYMKRLFERTGTNRQAELILVLLSRSR